MHMDAAALIGDGSGLLQLADDLLYGDDVLIVADGADHLGLVLIAGRYPLAALLALRLDAGVTHEFPLPPLRVQGCIGVIISPRIVG